MRRRRLKAGLRFECVAELEAGMQMELVLAPLYEDADAEYMVWKWRPA